MHLAHNANANYLDAKHELNKYGLGKSNGSGIRRAKGLPADLQKQHGLYLNN